MILELKQRDNYVVSTQKGIMIHEANQYCKSIRENFQIRKNNNRPTQRWLQKVSLCLQKGKQNCSSQRCVK